MAKKVQVKSKRNGEIKHVNKMQAKLQKKRKLKEKTYKKKMFKKTSKSAQVFSKENENSVIDNEDFDPTDMISRKDIKYLKKAAFQYKFLNLPTENATNKRKFHEVEAEYEIAPRRPFNNDKRMKAVLPIKGKQGIVQQFIEVTEPETPLTPKHEPSNQPHVTEECEENVSYSTEILSEKRKNKLFARRQKIANLSLQILENPEQNMKLLKELRLMLDEKDRDIVITNRKLVAASLLEVFKDILPSYRIRPIEDQEKKQQLKKETKHLQDLEQALLRHYKAYLQRLETMIKGLKNKGTTQGALCSLGEVALKCLCELLISHPSFNFRNNIISLIIPFMNHKKEEVSSLVCDTVKRLFKEDKLGEISLEIVKHIVRFLKEKNFMVHPKVLNTFLSLKIHISTTEDQGKKFMTRNEKMTKLSRMERKRNKQMEKLEMELLETRAEESKQQKSKLHTEIISKVFLVYFKILKTMTKSILLPSVLEGLAKFAHLINIDFFDDLISALDQCISSQALSYRENLHCIQTAFSVLSGQGDALNIDPQRFYTHLYRNLLSLRDGIPSSDIIILLICLDLAFTKRKKQVTLSRVLAFMKRLFVTSLHYPPKGILSILIFIKTLMQNHSQTDIFLDAEAVQGSGIYSLELDEPEHCNANAAKIWEVHLLNRHHDPQVQKLSNFLLQGCPLQKNPAISHMLTKSPEEIWNSDDALESIIETKSNFQTGRRSKTKLKDAAGNKLFLFEDLEEKVKATLAATEDCTSDVNYLKFFEQCVK